MTPLAIGALTGTVIFLFGVLIGAYIASEVHCRAHREELDNIKTAIKHPGGFNGR
jgi:uncharacterized membrane protein (DUF485 family)